MAADIARTSFDPARRYTGVVPQQGRVTVEADENEERVILTEERRLELLDVVGPAGTPDDGYLVSGAGTFDFSVGPGTMYVGGIRVDLDEAITYAKQPDWLDQSSDPDVEPGTTQGANEHVVLVLTETDVTAVEDPVLREVALGGPDTGARTRILQRVHRYPAEGDDCTEALESDVKLWAEQGLTFDPETMQLASNGRLLVEWDPPQGPADPCQPSAKGGYLGAENQAIRVQVVSTDPKTGTFDLLWGWDNASFLYRVSADESTNPVLTLDRSPVDDFHRPRAAQAVQVLRAAAELDATDGVIEGYVAALNGSAALLTAPYDPDTMSVQFPAALPAEYTDPDQTPQLYLRVWEELLTGNAPGDKLSLTGTGIEVVLTVEGGGPVHPGDYWTIAVRPETPDTVLPARLLRTPQPPDGPRMWACPLAVVGWSDGEFRLLDDCRNPFDPLVEQDAGGCCCTVSVEPADATELGLQAIVDKAVAGRTQHDPRRVTICMSPGRYELERPLLLERKHGRLHLEGCGEGVELAVKPGAEEEFAQGLIVLVQANSVRISGIEFHLPQVPAARAEIRKQQKELASFQKPVDAVYRSLYVSIGIRPVHCAMLEVDHCLFRFTLGEGKTTPETEDDAERNVFGVGIFAGSECWGMRVERNRFLHDAPRGARRAAASRTQAELNAARALLPSAGSLQHTLVGLLLVPSLVYRSDPTEAAGGLPSGSLVRSLLVRGRILGNEFNGLSIAAVAFAELGDVRIEDNVARDCYAGLWLMSLRAQAFTGLAGKYTVASNLVEGTLKGLRAVMVEAAANPTLQQISVVGRTYPLPEPFVASGSEKLAAQRAASKRAVTDQVEWTQQFVQQAVEPFMQAQTRTQAGKTPEAGKATETFALAAPAPATAQQKTTQQLHAALSDFERAVALAPPTHGFELRVTDNDLECAVGETDPTGAALMVWNTDDDVETSALVSDNRMSSLGEGPVAALMGVAEVVTTGNLVRNRQEGGLSLALVGATDVAVTGNILRGVPLLPVGRPFPSPLSNWLPLNTVRV